MSEPVRMVGVTEEQFDLVTRKKRMELILKKPQMFWISNRERPALERDGKITLRNRSLARRTLRPGERVILFVESTGVEMDAYVLSVEPESRMSKKKTSSSKVEVQLHWHHFTYDDFSCGGLLA